MILKCDFFTHFGSCFLKLHAVSTSHLGCFLSRELLRKQYIAQVLRPLEGKTIHSIKNSKELTDTLKHIMCRRAKSWYLMMYPPCSPVNQALTIIREKLHEDTTLKQRCQLDVEQVIELLGLCLNTTYFVHNNKFYQQTHRAAMGSPVSPIVCNLYMENFEKIMLSSAPSPPRCGSDMWTISL